jgi:hypothetical protein
MTFGLSVSEASWSAIIAAGSGLFGAVIGGALAAWGSVKAVRVASENLESNEIRRQKIQCVVALYGLRWVAGQGNAPEEYRAKLSYEMCKIVSLWADDTNVMVVLRDFHAETVIGGEKATQRLVQLLKLLGNGTGLPFDQLGDTDIKSGLSWIKSRS